MDDLVPTPSQTVGPFFHFCLTSENVVSAALRVRRLRGNVSGLRIRVVDGNGEGVPDAMIEIWQANSEGKYNHPDDPQTKMVEPDFLGFGRMGTGEDGSCEFETIKPGRVPGPEMSRRRRI